MYLIIHDGQYKICLSNLAKVNLYNCQTRKEIEGVDTLCQLLRCDYYKSYKDEIYNINEITIVTEITYKYKALKFQIGEMLKLSKEEMLEIWHNRYKSNEEL